MDNKIQITRKICGLDPSNYSLLLGNIQESAARIKAICELLADVDSAVLADGTAWRISQVIENEVNDIVVMTEVGQESWLQQKVKAVVAENLADGYTLFKTANSYELTDGPGNNPVLIINTTSPAIASCIAKTMIELIKREATA